MIANLLEAIANSPLEVQSLGWASCPSLIGILVDFNFRNISSNRSESYPPPLFAGKSFKA